MEEVILNDEDIRILMDLVDKERKILGQGVYPPAKKDSNLENLYEKLVDIAFMADEDV